MKLWIAFAVIVAIGVTGLVLNLREELSYPISVALFASGLLIMVMIKGIRGILR